jgi:hypothetical protein
VASEHEKSRVYVSLTGYRNDDFKPYVFQSDDNGKTWVSITGNLPEVAAVNVIKEDPKDENILYLGTDNYLYISMDRGENWQVIDGGLPVVAMYDLVVQEREDDLVVATHGRSIYKADLSSLRSYSKVKDEDLAILPMESVRYSSRWGDSRSRWYGSFEPELKFEVFSAKQALLKIEILSEDDKLLQRFSAEVDKGYNYLSYDLTASESWMKSYVKKHKSVSFEKADNGLFYLPKGSYKMKIGKVVQTFVIE